MATMNPRQSDFDALLRPSQVAALFSVCPKTVSRWSDAGILASVRTNGGHRRFRASAVSDLFDSRGVVGER